MIYQETLRADSKFKDLFDRLTSIEPQMPKFNTSIDNHDEEIARIKEKLDHLDEGFDKNRSRITKSENDIVDSLQMAKDLNRKL